MRRSVNATLATTNSGRLLASPSISHVRLSSPPVPFPGMGLLIRSREHTAVKNGTATLRERDTTTQRIGKIEEVVGIVVDMCNGSATWEDACNRLEEYSGKQDA
jgi:hypothetical protein